MLRGKIMAVPDQWTANGSYILRYCTFIKIKFMSMLVSSSKLVQKSLLNCLQIRFILQSGIMSHQFWWGCTRLCWFCPKLLPQQFTPHCKTSGRMKKILKLQAWLTKHKLLVLSFLWNTLKLSIKVWKNSAMCSSTLSTFCSRCSQKIPNIKAIDAREVLNKLLFIVYDSISS